LRKKKVFFVFSIFVFTLMNVNCTNPFMTMILEPKTITFDSNGGSSVPSQTVVKGVTVKKPASPGKTGNIFEEWYLDNSTFEIEWDFGIVPDGDVTLYAKWTDVNEYADGRGNPFKVYDPATLQKVGTGTDGWTLDANYEQIANINLSGIDSWTPIGSFSQFTGTFNGNRYNITGLTISVMENIDSQGLFCNIGRDGTVENLSLVSYSIGVGQGTNSGGVAGINYGTVRFCSVSGSIYGSGNIGGVVGNNNSGGKVQNCYSTVTVRGGNNGIGGVAGNNNGTLQNCYSTGNVEGGDFVGGTAGSTELPDGVIMNCVALNQEIKATGAGEHIGRVAGGDYGSRNNNYARNGMRLTASGSSQTPSGDLPTSNDGADVSDYNSESWWRNVGNWSPGGAWDFTSVWMWDNAERLPKLRNFAGQ